MDSIYEQWKRDFVDSKVIKRDRNIGQLGCVIHKISNKVSSTGQTVVSFCFAKNLILLLLISFWRVDFLSHSFTCTLARKETSPPPPLALLLCCAGFPGEMPAVAAVCLRDLSSSWHPLIDSFMFPSVLLPSDWAITSRVPLWFPALLGCVWTYCQGWSVGWLGDSYLSGGLFLHFSICDCKERILVAGWCTDLVRGTKTAK